MSIKGRIRMEISFEKTMVTARFRNPSLNFGVEEQIIEHRIDPLLGQLSLIPHELKQKASFYYGTPDKRALKKSIEGSRAMCFFCPEKLEQSTTKFIEEISEDGKINVGKAVAFPNLFPYFPHCAVITTDEHWIPLNEISADFYGDMIKAGIKYIQKAHGLEKSSLYSYIGANMLQPAGSSVIHPHIHALLGPHELYRMQLLRERSKGFKEATGKNFWNELIEKERTLQERYIAQTGDIHWYTPFAPIGNNEVHAVILGKSNFLELTEEDITLLGKGIANILHYYHKKKIFSYNFLLYSGPLEESKHNDDFYVGWQIVSRPAIRDLWVNDLFYLQTLGYGSMVFGFPESIAKDLKEFF